MTVLKDLHRPQKGMRLCSDVRPQRSILRPNSESTENSALNKFQRAPEDLFKESMAYPNACIIRLLKTCAFGHYLSSISKHTNFLGPAAFQEWPTLQNTCIFLLHSLKITRIIKNLILRR